MHNGGTSQSEYEGVCFMMRKEMVDVVDASFEGIGETSRI